MDELKPPLNPADAAMAETLAQMQNAQVGANVPDQNYTPFDPLTDPGYKAFQPGQALAGGMLYDPKTMGKQMPAMAPTSAAMPEVGGARLPQVEDMGVNVESAFAPQPADAQQAPAMPGTQGPGMGAYANAFEMDKQGVRAAVDAAKLRATETAGLLAHVNEQQELSRIAAEQKRAEIDKNIADEIQNFQNIQKNIKTLKDDGIYANKTTGQKIMTGIAIMLGGIGGAFTGKGDNKAMDVINQAMDRDIQLMKEQGNNSQTLLSMFNKQYDNSMQAEAAARMYILEGAKNELSRIASQYESDEIAAKAKSGIAAIDLRQQMFRDQFAQASAVKHALRQTVGGIGEDGVLSPEQEQLLAKVDPKRYEVYQNQQQRKVPGYGIALDVQSAKAARDLVGARDGMLETIRQIQQVVKENPVGVKAKIGNTSFTESASDAQTLYANLTAQYKDWKKLGTLDAGVERVLNKFFKDPSTLINPTNYQTVSNLINKDTEKSLAPLMSTRTQKTKTPLDNKFPRK